MTTSIFIRIDVDPSVKYPARYIGNILHRLTPILETQVVPQSGFLPDRISQSPLAEWTVQVS